MKNRLMFLVICVSLMNCKKSVVEPSVPTYVLNLENISNVLSRVEITYTNRYGVVTESKVLLNVAPNTKLSYVIKDFWKVRINITDTPKFLCRTAILKDNLYYREYSLEGRNDGAILLSIY